MAKKRVKKQASFQCSRCHMRFNSGRALNAHPCDSTDAQTSIIINDSAPGSSAIKKKRLTTKLRKCSYCHSYVKTNENYRVHLRTHLDFLSYECRECLACFCNIEYLESHMKSHAGDKPYSCTTCPNTSFYGLFALRRHEFTHSGPPYNCPICTANFSNVDARSIHVKNHVINCGLCPANFKNLQLLNDHLEGFHRGKQRIVSQDITKEDSEPDICPDEEDLINYFEYSDEASTAESNNQSLGKKKKKRKFKYVCFVCEQKFVSREMLNSHINGHNLYICVCGKFFSYLFELQQHEFEHSHISPFQCTTCGKVFCDPTEKEQHKIICSNKNNLVSSQSAQVDQLAQMTSAVPDTSNHVTNFVEWKRKYLLTGESGCK